MSLLRNSKKTWLIRLCKSIVIVNLVTIWFGIAFQVIAVYNLFFDIAGIFILTAWILNLYLIYSLNKFLIKTSKLGKKLNRLTYYFLLFIIAGLSLILIGVLFQSIILTGDLFFWGTILYHINISIGLFGIAILAIYLSIFTLITIDKREVFSFE